MPCGFKTTWGWVNNYFFGGRNSFSGHTAFIFPLLLWRVVFTRIVSGWHYCKLRAIIWPRQTTITSNFGNESGSLCVMLKGPSILTPWPDAIVYMSFFLIQLFPAVWYATSWLFAAYTCQLDKTLLFSPVPQNASERVHPVYGKSLSVWKLRKYAEKRSGTIGRIYGSS